MTLVSTDALQVGYRHRAILPSITMTVSRGEQWALMGPNGSGKTTFLKTILGLIPPVDGTFTIDDSIGYVGQRSTIDLRIPARVIDIVSGGIEHRWSFLDPRFVRRRQPQIARAIEETAIADLVDAQLSELSEGQKQRVLIARALTGDPALLVLDEPTSAMDNDAEATIFSLLQKLRESRDLGVVVVSHHVPVVVRHATHVLAVDKDRRFAFWGDVAQAVQNEEIRNRYGDLTSELS